MIDLVVTKLGPYVHDIAEVAKMGIAATLALTVADDIRTWFQVGVGVATFGYMVGKCVEVWIRVIRKWKGKESEADPE